MLLSTLICGCRSPWELAPWHAGVFGRQRQRPLSVRRRSAVSRGHTGQEPGAQHADTRSCLTRSRKQRGEEKGEHRKRRCQDLIGLGCLEPRGLPAMPHRMPIRYRRLPWSQSGSFGRNFSWEFGRQRLAVKPVAGLTVEWPGGETPEPKLAFGNRTTTRMQLLCSIS